MRKAWPLVVIGCAALLTFGLCNGFVIANYWTFGGQATQPTEFGPRVTLWVDTNIRSIQISAIKLYSCSKLPFSIRLDLYATEIDFDTVRLDEVLIRYPKGQEKRLVEPSDRREMPFEDYAYANWTGGTLVKHRALKASRYFTNVIDAPVSFSITCKGTFVKNDRSVPFEVTEDFVPRKVAGIFRGWHTESP